MSIYGETGLFIMEVISQSHFHDDRSAPELWIEFVSEQSTFTKSIADSIEMFHFWLKWRGIVLNSKGCRVCGYN